MRWWRAESTTVVLAAVLAVISPLESKAQQESREDRSESGSDTLSVIQGTVPVQSWADQLYRLGISRFAHRDYAGALDALEAITYDTDFPYADRAAFLLATLYLRLGHREGLAQLSRKVQSLPASGFTRWIHAQTVMSAVRGGIDLPASARTDSEADLLAAAWLLSEGDIAGARSILSRVDCGSSDCQTLSLQLRGMADELGGDVNSDAWMTLARMEPKSELDRIWVEGAQLRLARRALERDQDPRTYFSEPTQVRDSQENTAQGGLGALEPWREHIRGLYAWQLGDTAVARRILEGIVTTWPGYPKVRAVEIALASLALESNDPAGARARALRADQSRQADALIIDTLHSERVLDELWKTWERGAGYGDPVRLDLASLREQTAVWIEAALAPILEEPKDLPPLPRLVNRPTEELQRAAEIVPIPPLESMRAVAGAEEASWEAYFELERTRSEIAATRLHLDRRRAYLESGLERVEGELALLRDSAKGLAEARGSIVELESSLRALRDEAIRRIEVRTEALRDRIDVQRRWVEALERIYVEGPGREVPGPADIPRASDLLDREAAQAEATDDLVRAFEETVPDAIARAYAELWRPKLTDGVDGLEAELAALIARAERLQSRIEGDLADIERSDELAALHDRGRRLAGRADSLALQHIELQRSTIRAAVNGAVEALAAESEAIDYLAGVATYDLARAARARQTREAMAADRNMTTLPDAAAARTSLLELHAEAVDRHRGFLESYPKSTSRADVRYRLADLLLTEERDRFQEEMARFLESGAGVPPIFDPVQAQEQYAALLEEDPKFSHRDAVLYQLGVLEADAGNSDAARHLASLLEDHPESRFRQEGELRLADFLSDDGRSERAISLYESAAGGPDRGLYAVALYKLGWGYFRADRFSDAADAFGRTLDLYLEGVPTDDRGIPDLRRESQEYLVHSLSRLGGGPAVADYFDRVGARAYESEVYADVTSLLRRFSLFAQAAETDRLWLLRYPLDERGPQIAARLIDSEVQGQRAEELRRDRLELAERFLPEGAWQDVARSDSLRTEAETFARENLRALAWEHHRAARSAEDDVDTRSTSQMIDANAAGAKREAEPHWRDALALYERITSIWPGVPEASRDRFHAGEAAYRLGDYERAYLHYSAAAAADTATFAPEAQWQRIASLDAWYYATGEDSLARRFMDASDEYLDRNLADDRAAGLSWRRAHVALERQWSDVATEELARFVERFPGDERVAQAAALRGDALLDKSALSAARAYDAALQLARRAGDKELEARLESALPAAEFKHAESVDESDRGKLFRDLAERRPGYEHADLALYRAGLAYRAAGEPKSAAEAWSRIAERYPKSEYARDAELELARAWSEAGNAPDAARVYERFAGTYPEDPEAADALLRAGDLWEEAGDIGESDRVRLLYVDRHPEDSATAYALLEPIATRTLDKVPADAPIDEWIETSPALALFVDKAADDPSLGGEVLARIAFMRGEEARARYDAVQLTQPIQESIVVKKEALEALLAEYRDCATRAVAPWAHAATFRIGEALVKFGASLAAVEAPAELAEPDAAAYLEVLQEQAWDFYDQGEQVWSDLLRSVAEVESSDDGGWIRQTQQALWMRVPLRFIHYAEVRYPVLHAIPPEEFGR